MNKKGNFGAILLIAFVTMFIFVLGFIFVMSSATLNYFTDEVIPPIKDVGQVGETNFTEIGEIVLDPVDESASAFNWLVGVGMVLSLGMIIGLAYAFRGTGNYWLLGFYFVLTLLMIIISMLISNSYDNFYYGTDFLATNLQAQPIASYLLLYAPAIYTVIAFIGGIIMFTGNKEEGGFI